MFASAPGNLRSQSASWAPVCGAARDLAATAAA